MHTKKVIKMFLVFTCLIILPSFSTSVISDGCVFIPTVEQWISSPEEKQIGLINYQNGIENLTIVIDIKNSSLSTDEAFWIFPIPGNPEGIDIYIIEEKEIDFYYGGYKDVRNGVKETVSTNLMFLSFSQAYLSMIPFFKIFLLSYNVAYAINEDISVSIHETAEKMGFTAQLISAETSSAISQYLESKNVTLDSSASNLIDEYIGKDFCFVAAWISDINEFKKQAMSNQNNHYWHYFYDEPFYMLGISVEFPTEDIYYPMKMTSIYGEEKIPILIQINGHVSPKNTYNGMITNYYTYDGSYTEISINTKSSDFTEDFYIENKEPSDVANAKFIKNNSLLFAIIVFILCSIFASLLSSFIVYRKNKPDYRKFSLLGFGNFLSIFFVFTMCFVLKINQKFLTKPIKNKEVSKIFDKSFKITFLILGLISLVLFLLAFFPYMIFLSLFLLSIFSLVIGILMFIYGGFKNPKATLYTALFSIFFIIFLIIAGIITELML